MTTTIGKAAFNDALAIQSAKIMVNNVERGFVTGLTVNGKSPEDLINCISWTLRRRKPMTTDWSVDAAVLYNNLKDLQALKGWTLFNIEVTFVNLINIDADASGIYDTSAGNVNINAASGNNVGQKLTLYNCRITDHSVNITEASTFKFSGNCSSRDSVEKTSM